MVNLSGVSRFHRRVKSPAFVFHLRATRPRSRCSCRNITFFGWPPSEVPAVAKYVKVEIHSFQRPLQAPIWVLLPTTWPRSTRAPLGNCNRYWGSLNIVSHPDKQRAVPHVKPTTQVVVHPRAYADDRVPSGRRCGVTGGNLDVTFLIPESQNPLYAFDAPHTYAYFLV